MRDHGLAGPTAQLLDTRECRQFVHEAAWTKHLDKLGITASVVSPDPVRVATEGALWGAICGHGFLCDAVIVRDDAGQFNVGEHALCWVLGAR